MNKFWLSILPVFLLVTACQKEPDLSDLDNDFLVFTNRDGEFSFSSPTTFYIPDSILIIGESEKATYWTGSQAGPILDVFISTMERRGYTQVNDKEDADLGLQVSYVERVNYFVNDYYYDYPYWWWDYPGYWGPGYWGSGWYDWYYPYPVVYSYNTGSLLAEMINLSAGQSTPSTQLPVVWTAYMSGLLSGSATINTQLAIRAVEQAFAQSQYISK